MLLLILLGWFGLSVLASIVWCCLRRYEKAAARGPALEDEHPAAPDAATRARRPANTSA